MGVGRRIMLYAIIFLVVLFVLSCISVYMHKEVLTASFSNTVSSLSGLGLFLIIIFIAFGLMLKPFFR